MSRSQGASRAGQERLSEALLKSINVVYDSEEPDRVAHFRPTSKSVSLIRALSGEADERATIVVAPYGTGKSIAATYLLHVIEGRPSAADALKPIERRLERVSPELASWVRKRRSAKRKGLVVALSGYQQDLPGAMKAAVLHGMKRARLGRQARPIRDLPCESVEELTALLDLLKDKCTAAGVDRVAIVWDEFGRHLEALLAETRPDRLHDLQTLAEYVSRSTECKMSLGLLLHRRLMQYAGAAPQAIREEWQKIEGRFTTLEYIDDSQEVYRLLAECLASKHEPGARSRRDGERLAGRCHDLGIFRDFSKKDLAGLIDASYPLHPLTLYLLPRFASRISQNERTLFGFLSRLTAKEEIGLDQLYEYFSPAMQSDTSAGGTHRHWLETESALSKVETETESRVLKSACVLGIGVFGGRARTPLGQLQFARTAAESENEWQATIDRLLSRKLLLYRKHSDEVTVWHGADVDLLGRLQEERERQDSGFQLLDFVEREAPAPVWRPVAYNSEKGVRRFFRGEYHTLRTLKEEWGLLGFHGELSPGVDGKILYVLPESPADLLEAHDFALQELRHAQIVVAAPNESGPLRETALELHCLQEMRRDGDLLSSDPLVEAELQQMMDDARGRLLGVLERMMRPAAGGPSWYYQGRRLPVHGTGDLLRHLSEIMHAVFPQTPVIQNEMIVRSKPSPIVVNARRKLILGILERSGSRNLGLEGNFPDASMFRTVLRNTGLYRECEDGNWGYAEPWELQDEALAEVWRRFQDFVSTPSSAPKSLSGFINGLKSPPIGVRQGLLPILFAAAVKAFPCFLSIARDGRYVEDLLPTAVEEMCRRPDEYQVNVRPLTESEKNLLEEMIALFTSGRAEATSSDRVRCLHDALVQWRTELPPAARTTRNLSDSAARLRDAVFTGVDPLRLATDVVPSIFSGADPLGSLALAKEEIEGVSNRYETEARRCVLKALGTEKPATSTDMRDVVSSWAGCFASGVVDSLPEGTGKALLRQVQARYATERSLLDRLSGLILGRPLARWDDSSPAQFEKRLADVVHEVEVAGLEQGVRKPLSGEERGPLAELAKRRVEEWVQRLRPLLGDVETDSFLGNLTATRVGGTDANDI